MVKIQSKPILAVSVYFENEHIFMHLNDGRIIGCPVKWFPRLSNATDEQRSNWELIADGYGVHWSDIDEDLSAEGMLTFSKHPL